MPKVLGSNRNRGKLNKSQTNNTSRMAMNAPVGVKKWGNSCSERMALEQKSSQRIIRCRGSSSIQERCCYECLMSCLKIFQARHFPNGLIILTDIKSRLLCSNNPSIISLQPSFFYETKVGQRLNFWKTFYCFLLSRFSVSFIIFECQGNAFIQFQSRKNKADACERFRTKQRKLPFIESGVVSFI